MAENKNMEEVQGAIEAFEQILEAVPEDRVALQALFESHEELGETDKALQYLIRLSSVVADETDILAAPHLLAKLDQYNDKSAEVAKVIKQLQELVAQSPVSDQPAKESTSSASPIRRSRDITAEMSLAWNLLQAEELTQEEYSQVVQDLSESVSKKLDVPVTVLHVLTDRGAKSIDRIIAFLAKTTTTPFVHLKSYELQPKVYNLLPINFMEHAAAMPITTMDTDVLVAVLNPYDMDLRADVENVIGKKCHFYMTTALEYDERLDAIRAAVKESQAENEPQEEEKEDDKD